MQNIHWSHGWGLAGQVIAVAAIVIALIALYVAFGAWIGKKLHEMDVKHQERVRRDRERCRRLAMLASLAEAIHKAPDAATKRRLYLQAETISWLSDDSQYKPFMLDAETPRMVS